ncbi:hypothetical protein [Sulfurimonas sp.]
MRYFFTAIIVTILLSGCATKNAFSKLEISEVQELATENTRSGNIKLGEKSGGIFSAVFLNNIFQDKEKNTNDFYICVFIKNKNEELKIKLNNKEPIEIKELPHANEFAELLTITSDWTKNYFVSFKKDVDTSIILEIENGQFSSGELYYPKD